VTQARSIDEAANVHRRLDTVSRKFLSRPLPLAAVIPLDPNVPQAVRDRVPFITSSPACRAAKGVKLLAKGAADSLTLAKPPADRPALVARFLRSLAR
jgi:MinD-like ATPase involved in chromosome partitioning or flagellar assembly